MFSPYVATILIRNNDEQRRRHVDRPRGSRVRGRKT